MSKRRIGLWLRTKPLQWLSDVFRALAAPCNWLGESLLKVSIACAKKSTAAWRQENDRLQAELNALRQERERFRQSQRLS